MRNNVMSKGDHTSDEHGAQKSSVVESCLLDSDFDSLFVPELERFEHEDSDYAD